MKKLQKLSAVISTLLLMVNVLLFTSCDQLLGKAKDTIDDIEKEIIDEALAKMGDDFIPSVIEADTDSINLPKSIPDYEAVKLSWSSSDTDIIDVATGKVTHKEGKSVDEVTLTATLSYEGKTRTKAYNVEVKQKTPDILAKAYAAMVDDLIPTLVTGESITLPKTVPGYSDVTITWTSSDDSIIKASTGAVTHQAGTGDDEVTLTATLTYEGKTKTKEYTVKVPQADKELTDEEILEAAKSEVVINYTGENFREEVAIPETITVHGKTVAVSVAFAAGSAGASFTTNGNNVLIEKDLIEQTAKLHISLSYNGDFVTKEVSIEVPAMTEFIHDDYSNGIKEHTIKITLDSETNTLRYDNIWKSYGEYGTQYSYELLKNHKLKLTTTKIKNKSDWVTLDAMVEQSVSKYREVAKIFDNPPATYAELYAVLKAIYGDMYMSEAEFYEMMAENAGASMDDSAEKQAMIIKAYIQSYTSSMGLSEDFTIDDLINWEIERALLRYPNETVYSYIIWDKSQDLTTYPNGASILITAKYDSSKPWYKQIGSFYDGTHQVSNSDIYINNQEYSGNWNRTYTSFTATSGESPFSINVTDNKDGTVTISGGILENPVVLEFWGSSFDF